MTEAGTVAAERVIWHDLECGGYGADLPLWRELAAAAAGQVLDLGAGTGRVALDLAARGHDVTAVDLDAELLATLRHRAGDVPVHTVEADARDYDLGRRFALILAPMQIVQILGGPNARAKFLACARRHLDDGGLIALAIACDIEPIDTELEGLPLPDMREIDGVVYSSQPVALRPRGDHFVIERLREVVDPAGARRVSRDEIRLDRVTLPQIIAEAESAGLRPAEVRRIAETDEHVASDVVLLHA